MSLLFYGGHEDVAKKAAASGTAMRLPAWTRRQKWEKDCILQLGMHRRALVRLYRDWSGKITKLIIGVPVTALSMSCHVKELIISLPDTPYIVAKEAEKGGNNVAAAITAITLIYQLTRK